MREQVRVETVYQSIFHQQKKLRRIQWSQIQFAYLHNVRKHEQNT